MSFEGYYQLLCKNGHTTSIDCYVHDDEMKCHCGENFVWKNLVDVTNGSFDEEGNRIDGYVELEVESQNICGCCDSVLETKYKIPNE